MEFGELMEKLKKYKPTEYPFVTQYMNTHWEDEFHKKRSILFFKNQWNAAIEGFRKNHAPNHIIRSLHAARQRIEEYMRDQMHGAIDGQFHGLAFFVSSGAGFFEIFRSNVEFEDELCVHEHPHLKQLARLADEYEKMMLVMVDASRARVYELHLGSADRRLSVFEEMPARHKVGGWSQMRFQRHVDEHHDSHFKDVAEVVEHLLDRENMKNVVIAGQDEDLSEFSRFLPKRVLEKVFMTLRLDITEPEKTVIRKVIEHLQQHEREKDDQGVREALNQAAIGGKGAVGLLATLKAINARGVRILYLSRDFAGKGILCKSCGTLHLPADRCPDCEGEVQEVSLADEMANAVIAAGGEVNIVERSETLGEFEGVAAATRFEKARTA